MSEFAHIIAKRHLDRWSAWFEETPYILSESDFVSDAIHGLMKVHELTDLSMVEVVTVDGGADQVEIRVPGANR